MLSETCSAPPTILDCLRRPIPSLQAVDGAPLSRLPWMAWVWLVLIAVGGSCLYGASLAAVFPGWRPGRGAAWLALSAGIAWCCFGPVLIGLSRRRPWSLAHACLVTMAYGEAVLQLAALGNLLLVTRMPGLAVPYNGAAVGAANLVMAGMLALQLRSLEVPAVVTLSAWMVVLNGGGALLFALFYHLLGGLR